MKKVQLLLLLLASSLTACATITEGTTQQVMVKTTPDSGADCELQNANGSWVVKGTPANVMIKKAREKMNVTCKHPNGSKGSKLVESDTKADTFGNIILGGGIGAVVDMSNGAAYIYPSEINVELSN